MFIFVLYNEVFCQNEFSNDDSMGMPLLLPISRFYLGVFMMACLASPQGASLRKIRVIESES
jgi:hypothetical protein